MRARTAAVVVCVLLLAGATWLGLREREVSPPAVQARGRCSASQKLRVSGLLNNVPEPDAAPARLVVHVVATVEIVVAK